MDVDGDGKDDIVTFEQKTRKLIAFKNRGDYSAPTWELVELLDVENKPWAHIQDVLKTPPFTVVDWDSDGKRDLIVGTNHPSIMVHSFGTDPELMNPEAFRMYFVKNIGDQEAKFGFPQMITDRWRSGQFLGLGISTHL